MNILQRRSLKILVPLVVLGLAQLIHGLLAMKGKGSQEVYWARGYDAVAGVSEWLDSFLPESVYNDVDLWSSANDEDTSHPMQFKPAMDNGSQVDLDSKSYFSGSMRPRRWRTSNILFRVGELIYHSTLNLYCVIVGWDKIAKAPPDWLDKVYKEAREEKQSQAHYMSICATESSSEDNIFSYIAQDEITRVDTIPEPFVFKLTYLQAHFNIKTESELQRKNGPYLLRPWLRKLYPSD